MAKPLNRFFLPAFLSTIYCVFVYLILNSYLTVPLEAGAALLGFVVLAAIAFRFLGKASPCYFAIATVVFLPLTLLLPSFYVIDTQLALLFVAAHLVWQKDLKTTLKKLGLPGDLKRNLLYGIGGFILVLASAALLSSIASHLLGAEDAQKILGKVDALPLYVLILAVVLAPFAEELFFRAVLTERFGIVISSFAFMLAHVAYGSLTELAGAFVLGLVFALVYKRSGSITSCILMHFLYNLIALLSMGVFR